jgi:hypothetical protein
MEGCGTADCFRPAVPRGSYSEQVAATILTESTFSVGLVDADEEAELEPALSSVPLISTLWPTCGVSFASSPFKR